MCLRTRMLSPTNINPYFQMNKSPYCYQIHSPNLCVPAVPQACLQGSRYVHRVCSMRPHIVPRAACHTHMNTTVYLSFCSRMCPSHYYTYIHTFYMHFFLFTHTLILSEYLSSPRDVCSTSVFSTCAETHSHRKCIELNNQCVACTHRLYAHKYRQ